MASSPKPAGPWERDLSYVQYIQSSQHSPFRRCLWGTGLQALWPFPSKRALRKWCQASSHLLATLTCCVGLFRATSDTSPRQDLDGGTAVCTRRHLHGEHCQEQPCKGRRMGLDTRTKLCFGQRTYYSFPTFNKLHE